MKALGLCAACLVWLFGAAAAKAADLKDPVPGHPGLTYLTLVRTVVTDLAADGSGHKVGPFQFIESKGGRADPSDPVSIGDLDVRAIPGQPSRLLLLADLGPSEGNAADAVLLVLFDLSAPKPKRLDVTEVGGDRFIDFLGDKPLQMLAPGAPLILIGSSHENTSQSYLVTEMIFIRQDRFQFIDSVSTRGTTMCSYQRDRDPTFSTMADPGPYRAIQIVVRQKVTRSGEDCGDEKPPKAGSPPIRPSTAGTP
jgi:hypothetical protein